MLQLRRFQNGDRAMRSQMCPWGFLFAGCHLGCWRTICNRCRRSGCPTRYRIQIQLTHRDPCSPYFWGWLVKYFFFIELNSKIHLFRKKNNFKSKLLVLNWLFMIKKLRSQQKQTSSRPLRVKFICLLIFFLNSDHVLFNTCVWTYNLLSIFLTNKNLYDQFKNQIKANLKLYINFEEIQTIFDRYYRCLEMILRFCIQIHMKVVIEFVLWT